MEHSWAGKIDLCIGLKFPAYYIPHSNKVVWALHQHRAAYDLFDTEYSNLKDNEDGQYYRNVIYNADNIYLDTPVILPNSKKYSEVDAVIVTPVFASVLEYKVCDTWVWGLLLSNTSV